MDHQQLGRELIRALRGRRSQQALSRRLGFRSNVLYMWESGRREPAASELFRLADKVGIRPADAWERFPLRLAGADLKTPAGIHTLLLELRGNTRIARVAEQCGVSRFTASRWLSGHTEPRLGSFLALVDVLSLRLVDFVSALIEPDKLPSLASNWRELERRREIAFTHPWSQAILRCLETQAYASLKSHSDGWLAGRLGIPPQVEAAALGALLDAGLIEWTGVRYQTRPVAVDTSLASPAQRRELKLHWSDVGRERIATSSAGLFSWSVFAVSQEDFSKLQDLHIKYMTELRQLVDGSQPSEVVALANVQLFALADDTSP